MTTNSHNQPELTVEERQRWVRGSLDEIRLEAGRLYRRLGLSYLREEEDLAKKAGKIEERIRDLNASVERHMQRVRRMLDS